MQKLFNSNAFILIIIAVSLSIALFFTGLFLGVYRNNAKQDAAGLRQAAVNAKQAEKLDVGNSLRAITVDEIFERDYIPSYSFSQVCNMDMSKPSGVTVEDLKLVTRYELVGLEEKLYQMEQDYDLNCLFLLGIASHESAYGTSQFHPNNICGYGYSGFSSKEACLDKVGRALAKYYLNPSGPYYKGTTIDAVNRTYAADPAWDRKVANKITYFYKIISEQHNDQLNKLK